MRRPRLSVVAALILISALALASVALAATRSVGVRKDGDRWLFTPSSLTINRGDTVRWSWRGRVVHNVAGPGFVSKTAKRLTYSHTFPRAGRFTVICQIHQAAGQRMRIVVR